MVKVNQIVSREQSTATRLTITVHHNRRPYKFYGDEFQNDNAAQAVAKGIAYSNPGIRVKVTKDGETIGNYKA